MSTHHTPTPGSDHNGAQPVPTLKPTSVSALLCAFLIGGTVSYLLVGRFYSYLPILHWYYALMIVVIAFILGCFAWRTRDQVRNRLGVGSTNTASTNAGNTNAGRTNVLHRVLDDAGITFSALFISRLAVLGKAGALAGAVLAGAYSGFAGWLALQSARPTESVSHDLTLAVALAVACVVLAACALWLENSCRVPPGSEKNPHVTVDPTKTD